MSRRRPRSTLLPYTTLFRSTGTAQVATLAKGARLKTHEMAWEERDHAWFAAVAPAGAPEIPGVMGNEHGGHGGSDAADRKSTRLNSSHANISDGGFCLE